MILTLQKTIRKTTTLDWIILAIKQKVHVCCKIQTKSNLIHHYPYSNRKLNMNIHETTYRFYYQYSRKLDVRSSADRNPLFFFSSITYGNDFKCRYTQFDSKQFYLYVYADDDALSNCENTLWLLLSILIQEAWILKTNIHGKTDGLVSRKMGTVDMLTP